MARRSPAPGAGSAAVLAAVSVAALTLLAVAAAAGGPVEFGPPRLPVSLGGAAEQLGDLGDVQGRGEDAGPFAPRPPETPWALILLAVVGTVLAALAIRSLRPARVPPAAAVPAHERAPDLHDPDADQLASLRRAARAGRVRLAAAPPGRARDGVVAAWLALEQAAAACGTPRHPAQTPTEFTVAVLRRHAADPEATATLLRLYHLARFSTVPLPPHAASDAADALDAITGSLSGVPRG